MSWRSSGALWLAVLPGCFLVSPGYTVGETPGEDAGPPPVDAGRLAEDAGRREVDGGPLDAGPLPDGGVDAGCVDQCGGVCTNRQTDPANCGSCGTVCAWDRCVEGVCDDPVELVVGARHSCVRRRLGEIACWGENDYGEVGLLGGIAAPADGVPAVGRPRTIEGAPFPAAGVSAVVAMTCAFGTPEVNGIVRCWGGQGNNVNATLGRTGGASPTPTPVSGLTGVEHLSGSDGAHFCVIDAGGTTRCWGANSDGQLGPNGPPPVGGGSLSAMPVTVPLTNPVHLANGDNHTCAVLATGRLRCWGDNSEGQLGVGTRDDSSTPLSIAGLAGVTDVCGGFRHTCASDGRVVWCWGSQLFGAVGDGSMDARVLFPTRIEIPGGRDVDDVSCTGANTCVRATDGTVWCWGNNGFGVVGPPVVPSEVQRSPVQIDGITDAVSVAVGASHACALLEVVCWGSRSETGTGTVAGGLQYPPAPVLSPLEQAADASRPLTGRDRSLPCIPSHRLHC